MGKVYINDIEYPNILMERSNHFIKASKEFAELSSNDTHITIDADDESIHNFIRCRGKSGNRWNDIMIKMYIAYPEYVEVENDNIFNSPLFHDNFDKLIDDDKDKVIKNCIKRNDFAGIEKIYKHFDLLSKDNFSMLKDYVISQMRASEGDRIYMKCISDYNYDRRFSRCIYVSWMYDMLKYIDGILYDENSNIVRIEKDFIIMNGDRSRYNAFVSKYHIARDNEELEDILNKGHHTYIYITDKITMSIAGYNIKPEDFATWKIGAECYSLCCLFKDYPHEPHIHNWHVPNIKNTRSLFENSGVCDLSSMNFERCRYARKMFKNCKNVKLPQFSSKLKTPESDMY